MAIEWTWPSKVRSLNGYYMNIISMKDITYAHHWRTFVEQFPEPYDMFWMGWMCFNVWFTIRNSEWGHIAFQWKPCDERNNKDRLRVCQGIEKNKEVGHRKLWSHPEPVPVSPVTSSNSLPCCESRAGMIPLQTTPSI